jgi:GNAT superfamily N-acetyltransferase
MNITFKPLDETQWEQAYPIMVQLRTHHTMATFKAAVKEQQALNYQLYGAFVDGNLLAVAGARAVKTLARGHYLHVDDLVVDAEQRVKNIGRQLLEYLHDYALSQAMTSVFLDARPEARAFYDKLGYVLHGSPSMKHVFK